MALVTTTDPTRVAALCDGVVAQDPVGGTVFGTIAGIVRSGDGPCWAAHPDGDPLALVARSQPDTPLTCTPRWREEDLVALAEALGALDPLPASFAAPPHIVDVVCARLSRPVRERTDERLFRLDELTPARDVPGSVRVAADDDCEWLAEWFTDFTIEAFGRLFPGFDARKMVERGVTSSRCWIWCDAGGDAVSFAVRHPPVYGVSRVGPVYTPPGFRGHGYGSAATAAATRDILDGGDIACLYTDLANPTSNKIYAALGYRAVLDRTFVRFD